MGSLMAGAGTLGVVSKLPQIWTVWKEGGTGQLSAFAVGFPVFTLRIPGICMKGVEDGLVFGRCSLRSNLDQLLIWDVVGVQLPLRVAITHLYYFTRGG